MSGFVTTGLAWAALALATVPIILHLLNRRTLRRMEWAAMEFLLAALRRTRRKLRLEHLILLLLRIAMMVLLALFLARPMLSDTEYSWLAGVLKNEEKIFILDDSLSMNRQQAGLQGKIDTGLNAIRRDTTAIAEQRIQEAEAQNRTDSIKGVFIRSQSFGSSCSAWRTDCNFEPCFLR